MGDVTHNFDLSDFRCHCHACLALPNGPATKIEIIEATQRLRDILYVPLTVTRGVSCEAHNKAVGGAPDSRHLPQHADAVDILASNSAFALQIVEAALKTPEFTTFRVYEHHVHLDGRPGTRKFIASPE